VRFIFVSSLLLKSITRIATAVAERGGSGARRHGGASVLCGWWWSCHMSKLGLGFGRRVMTDSDRGDRGGGDVVRQWWCCLDYGR
jgi:hypothetical protein